MRPRERHLGSIDIYSDCKTNVRVLLLWHPGSFISGVDKFFIFPNLSDINVTVILYSDYVLYKLQRIPT